MKCNNVLWIYSNQKECGISTEIDNSPKKREGPEVDLNGKINILYNVYVVLCLCVYL